MIQDQQFIQTANLGDCGYSLFHVTKDDRLENYYVSETQQMYHNFPYQCGGEFGHDPNESVWLQHEYQDGDVIVMYSDGYGDNMFPSGMFQCIEDEIKDGLVTSLSKAADCLAIKAHWLGKNTEYLSPFNTEWRKAIAAEDPFAVQRWPKFLGPPIGGKHDDITVTVAQIFHEKPGEPRKGTAAADTHYKEAKTLYTGDIPTNRFDGFKRARYDTN